MMTQTIRYAVLMSSAAAAIQAQTTTAKKLMIANVQGLTAKVVTDAGAQSAVVRGQLAWHYETIASGGQALTLVNFNLIGTPVKTLRGLSGPWSVTLKPNGASTRQYNASTGALLVDLELVLHYRLLDQLLGEKPAVDDYFVPLTEWMKGSFEGKFSKPMPAQTTSNQVDGKGSAVLSQARVGAIRSIDFTVTPAIVQIISAPCDSFGMRSLAIQPVFIRSGREDLFPTGRSLDTSIAHAEAIWNKACITFEVREPVYVDNVDYKVLTRNERPALTAEVNNIDDAIRVFFIDSWDPIDTYGGGVTSGSGREDATIITADNNIDQVPASVNNLAHELGHVLSFCHPNDNDCHAPMVLGSPGTVMEPSGFWMDNPSLQSLANCSAAANPLLKFRAIYCCFRTDCDNSCR